MKKIVVKIGVDDKEDIDKLFDPKNVDSFPDYTLYFKNVKQLMAILSEQKLNLLQYVCKTTGYSVTKIAIELGRRKEAVSRDLHQLEKLGLVQMEKRGKKVFPTMEYSAIQIELKA